MPWGWECRAKLVKQLPIKDTEKRHTKYDGFQDPGPTHYEIPPILGGNGFSQIKRAPAYTFGLMLPIIQSKRAALPNAPVVNVRGMTRKGLSSIPQGKISELLADPGNKLNVPGPGAYNPRDLAQRKRPPAYGMRLAAKPPYEAWDQWTPSPNMYLPPIPGKRQPSYSFSGKVKLTEDKSLPGPGEHSPNFAYVKKRNEAYSFGNPYRYEKEELVPAPNEYCNKKYMYIKPTAPAPSFGIRHSQHLGEQVVFLKSSKLELLGKDLQ